MKKVMNLSFILLILLASGCSSQEEAEKNEKDLAKLKKEVSELRIENTKLKMENTKLEKKLKTIIKERTDSKN
ncbi:hypothetical protein P2R12_12145 [Cytobacillus oceanisediminis]|uniref:hypothetical protein n=1 Tax=Cytobacillus oceanisediminis TaxID=665099 RepID=UPI0023D9C612|nr:hypothetical protein [Cytobacillus oceanisediminis]MDF2037704.1 hypothetical protein [Cytobacillus oceanisediminis]